MLTLVFVFELLPTPGHTEWYLCPDLVLISCPICSWCAGKNMRFSLFCSCISASPSLLVFCVSPDDIKSSIKLLTAFGLWRLLQVSQSHDIVCYFNCCLCTMECMLYIGYKPWVWRDLQCCFQDSFLGKGVSTLPVNLKLAPSQKLPLLSKIRIALTVSVHNLKSTIPRKSISRWSAVCHAVCPC